MKEEKAVASGLYTTEAGASRKKAKAEKGVPDPTEEEGRALLKGAEPLEGGSVAVEEDDGEAD